MVIIENSGPDIVKTNYWETAHSEKGMFFVSLNAGAFRLLIPSGLEKDVLPEMRTACGLVISRGPWLDAGLSDAFEFLFDDHSPNPFALHVGAQQFDRLPVVEDAGRTFIFTAWASGCRKVFESSAHYRAVRALPCLKGLTR